MQTEVRRGGAAPVLLSEDALAAMLADVEMARRVSVAQFHRVVDDLNRRAGDAMWASWVRGGFWIMATEYQRELGEHEQAPTGQP